MLSCFRSIGASLHRRRSRRSTMQKRRASASGLDVVDWSSSACPSTPSMAPPLALLAPVRVPLAARGPAPLRIPYTPLESTGDSGEVHPFPLLAASSDRLPAG